MKRLIEIFSAASLIACAVLALLIVSTSGHAVAQVRPYNACYPYPCSTPPPRTPTPPPRTPTPQPTPTLPPPRPPTSSDMSQFQSFVDSVNPNDPPITHLAIVGSFAVVYWVNGEVGGGIVLTESNGTWQMVAHGNGAYAVVDLLHVAPQMGVPTAEALANQAQIEVPPH